MTATPKLSKDDVKRLLTDRSVKTQIDLVEKLTDHYAVEGHGEFSPEQRALANDIFALLLTRTETIVRAMLSMQLSQMENLPHDLAKKMADDVNEVASPVLQYSDVLSDDDLVDIINSMVDTQKLQSIAQRDNVSENVSDILVNTKLDSVITTLVKNEGASITDKTFEKIVQNYNDNTEVMESVFGRTRIPAAVVEKVIGHLSTAVKQHLEEKYGSLTEMKAFRQALEKSLELTSVKMMGFESSDKGLMKLINWLKENDTLSPFSALSICNLQLFAVSLSRILRIPIANIELLLRDPEGLKTVYERAKLPPSLFEATRLTIDAIIQCELENARKEVLDSTRVIEHMKKMSKGHKVDGVEYIYAMMQHCKI